MDKFMDWTVKDNMARGLFFGATLTSRRRAVPHFSKPEGKRSTPVRRTLSRTHAVLWVLTSGMKVRSLVVLFNQSRIKFGDPPRKSHFCCCGQMNWCVVARRARMGVSIWDAVHSQSVDRWVLSGADVKAPWHGVLEAVWLLCDEAQQVGCLRGLEGCPLVHVADIQSQFARRRWWQGQINRCERYSSKWAAIHCIMWSASALGLYYQVTEGGTRRLIYGLVKKRSSSWDLSLRGDKTVAFKHRKTVSFESFFVPVLTYGCESWVMTERMLSPVQAVRMRLWKEFTVWHFVTKCAAVKFVKPWRSSYFSDLRDMS